VMKCKEFTERVTDYLDGRVPFGEQMGMWLHSAMCVHCRRYLDQMREVADMMGEIEETDAERDCPDDLKDDLLDDFRAKQAE